MDESGDPADVWGQESPHAEGWHCPVTWPSCQLSGTEHHHHAKCFQQQQRWEDTATPLPVSSYSAHVGDSTFSTALVEEMAKFSLMF